MINLPSTMLSPEAVTQYLTDFYTNHLPISDYLGMRVEQYTTQCLSLAIDLQPSINDKLTAFGGSLYSACVMSCWGMCYLQGRQRGINPTIVVSRGSIDYLAPVNDEKIIARCDSPKELDWQAVYATFVNKGKAKIKLSSTIHCQGKEAVIFNGHYAIIGLNIDTSN